MDNLLHRLDETITEVLSKWDIFSTTLLATILAFVAYQVFTARDPDAHPFLLARQSQPSPVRLLGQSAVYRGHATPHGMALVAGLGVKDEGDPKWSPGRNGDLRDVWRRVVMGAVDRQGTQTGHRGKLMTVLGKEKAVEHNIDAITRQINLIGKHLQQNGAARVAIFLPNSIELLAALFACAFYDLVAVLVPYEQEKDVTPMLKQAKADAVIAPVGSLTFDASAISKMGLRQLIWVVDEGSQHLDWNEVPHGTGGPVNVATWQEIIQDAVSQEGMALPDVDRKSTTKSVLAFAPGGHLFEYSPANLVAGIAGQTNALPSVQRLTPMDTYLPVDSLANIYTLTMTLSALYSNAGVTLNSVAGPSVSLEIATAGSCPTVVSCSSQTLADLHSSAHTRFSSTFYNLLYRFQTRTLVQDGVMPLSSMFSRFFDHLRPVLGSSPGKLRLIYVAHQIGGPEAPISAEMLSDVRIYTGARVVYALTSPAVVGAVCQTGLYDYRVDGQSASIKYSHFGPPVPSVEVFMKDTKELQTTDDQGRGEVVVRGPAVVEGEAALGVTGRWNTDGTLALL